MSAEWTMDWYDYVRVFNVMVALAAMYFLGLRFIRNTDTFTSKIKDYWWALNALMFTIVAGQTEQVLRNREETWVLFIIFFAALICLKAARNKDVVMSSRPPTNSETDMSS